LEIYVLHYSVATQLKRVGIYNNHIMANCLQSAPLKEFWSVIGKDIDKSKVPRFYGPRCRIGPVHFFAECCKRHLDLEVILILCHQSRFPIIWNVLLQNLSSVI